MNELLAPLDRMHIRFMEMVRRVMASNEVHKAPSLDEFGRFYSAIGDKVLQTPQNLRRISPMLGGTMQEVSKTAGATAGRLGALDRLMKGLGR